jgi:simple sugar transport system permease protein
MSDEVRDGGDGGEEGGTSRLGSLARGGRLGRHFAERRETGVAIAFTVLFGLIAVTRPDIFFNWDSMSGITARLLRQVTPFLLIGIGMTYLIIGGEFDLSVGSMFAVGGLLYATLANKYAIPVLAAMLIVVLVSTGIGLTNGIITTKIGVPSLITTIGMLSVLRGIAFFLTPGGSLNAPESYLTEILGGTQILFGVRTNNQVFYALGLLIVFGIILQRTRFGHHVYATGDNEDSARKTGIDTDRVKMINFVLTAILAALAGMMAISQFGSLFGTAGRGYELSIIAAVVVGGTDLFGGEGSITGTFLGALVIGIIPVFLLLNGLAVEIQELLTGIVIILAVVLDTIIRD